MYYFIIVSSINYFWVLPGRTTIQNHTEPVNPWRMQIAKARFLLLLLSVATRGDITIPISIDGNTVEITFRLGAIAAGVREIEATYALGASQREQLVWHLVNDHDVPMQEFNCLDFTRAADKLECEVSDEERCLPYEQTKLKRHQLN
jgi:hypothetical protein